MHDDGQQLWDLLKPELEAGGSPNDQDISGIRARCTYFLIANNRELTLRMFLDYARSMEHEHTLWYDPRVKTAPTLHEDDGKTDLMKALDGASKEREGIVRDLSSHIVFLYKEGSLGYGDLMPLLIEAMKFAVKKHGHFRDLETKTAHMREIHPIIDAMAALAEDEYKRSYSVADQLLCGLFLGVAVQWIGHGERAIAIVLDSIKDAIKRRFYYEPGLADRVFNTIKESMPQVDKATSRHLRR